MTLFSSAHMSGGWVSEWSSVFYDVVAVFLICTREILLLETCFVKFPPPPPMFSSDWLLMAEYRCELRYGGMWDGWFEDWCRSRYRYWCWLRFRLNLTQNSACMYPNFLVTLLRSFILVYFSLFFLFHLIVVVGFVVRSLPFLVFVLVVFVPFYVFVVVYSDEYIFVVAEVLQVHLYLLLYCSFLPFHLFFIARSLQFTFRFCILYSFNFMY